MITDLIINEEIKKFLRKPLGKLIQEKNLHSYFNDELIAVGDKVTLTCLKLGLVPRLAIVDYKIKRKQITAKEKRQLKNFGTVVLQAKNDAGTISLEAWEKVKEALNLQKAIAKIEVSGEEDLLALAVILNAKEGDRIIYGQPRNALRSASSISQSEGFIQHQRLGGATTPATTLALCRSAREGIVLVEVTNEKKRE